MFLAGKSKLRWPDSKHNKQPSLAVDIAPYPINWHDTGRFKLLAEIVFGVASYSGINLRWGGDWDENWRMDNEKFIDLPHFEIV